MTLTELRQALRAAGRDPEVVGYANDPEFPKNEGNSQLRRLRDGRWETSILGRGKTHGRLRYGTEEQAVDALAQRLLTVRPTMHMSDEEWEVGAERMQEKLRLDAQELEQSRDPRAWLSRWLERRADRRGRQGPRRGY